MPTLGDSAEVQVVYDDAISMRNLTACQRWVTPGSRLVHDTWVHAAWHTHLPQWQRRSVNDRPNCYIYPIGCFNAPHDWAGMPLQGAQHQQALLDFLPPEVLEDARDGRVLLVLDQSQEGNANTGLWSWLHAHLGSHGIGMSQLVYMTGDQLAEHSYHRWCDVHAISQRLLVISSWFNQHAVAMNLAHTNDLPEPDHHHRGTVGRLYNCLNRMPHEHRKQLWMALWRADLLDHGLVSMPAWDTGNRLADGLLPMVVDHRDFQQNWFNDINPWIYRNSWISVVTETYVDDAQLLIGEKVFKPMWCHSPFMILGTTGTLERLRQRGFKTFDGIWDESYDVMADSQQRIAAITGQLARLVAHTDLRGLMQDARQAILHNRQLAAEQWPSSAEYHRLIDVWRKMQHKFAV